MIAGRRSGCIYVRGRSRRLTDGPQLVPESFWTRFGEDTAVVDTNYEPPQIRTWADLGRAKRQRQAENLRYKQEAHFRSNVRPIYVWVFHCPGLGGFAYRGWWTYLVWRGGNSGKYLAKDKPGVIRQLMELFPMAQRDLYGPGITHDEWMPRFAKAFCCRNSDGSARKHAGRIQGKALLWAEFHGDCFWRIIGRADLSSNGLENGKS